MTKMTELAKLATMLRWALPDQGPGPEWKRCMDLIDQLVDEAVRMETAAYWRGYKEGSNVATTS